MTTTLTRAQRHGLAWLAIAATFALLLWLLGPVLTPFVVALVLGYALHPLVERVVRLRVPRVLAVLVVEVLFLLVCAALALLVVPILSKELPLLRDQIPLLAARLDESLTPLLARVGVDVQLDVSSIKAFVLKYFSTNASDWAVTLLSSARVGGGVLLSMVAAMLLLPVVLFYFLMDWPRIVRHFTALVPPRYSAAVDAFVLECDHMLGQYLRGQLLVMLLLACFYSAGLALFGFQLALPVGIFTGLAVFVPYVGFGLGLVLAVLAAALQFGSVYGFVGVAVVYGLGQIVEGFFLTPRLVGERIGLHPVVVIFALLAFGHLFGFVGVLVALPVCAVLVVAFQRLQVFYFASPLYRA